VSQSVIGQRESVKVIPSYVVKVKGYLGGLLASDAVNALS